jgi:hypothetical protein
MNVFIGDLSFGSKKSAKDYFRKILHSYGDGEILSDTDFKCLLALLDNHSEAEEKIGVGVSSFSVAADDTFHTTKHFVVHRLDGTKTDFSFLNCIDGKNPKREKSASLRDAIRPQIDAFKTDSFKSGEVFCPIYGTKLSYKECHVDHISPNTFEKLVDEWLKDECMSIEDVEITQSSDNQIVPKMSNEYQRNSWIQFHLENAKLRILSAKANLSDAKKHV